MPRVVSIFLPTWPTDRIRKAKARRGSAAPDAASPEGPVVTVLREAPRRMIAAVNAPARAIGLRPGLPVASAQASVPGLVIADATPDDDAEALVTLAAWCLRYAPVVQADPPDGIFIDVGGAAHLFGGEAALMDDLAARLSRAGIAVRIAMADTPGAAAGAARFGETRLVPPGGTVAAMAGLPVAALRLPENTREALDRLGIVRIGQLAQMPRASLTLRFGPEVVERYDRALGHASDPLTPLVPPETPSARLAFPEPLGHADGLAAAVMQLAHALCQDLASRDRGVRQLDGVFRRVDGRPIGIRVGTAAPSRDPGHLARLLLARLVEVDPGFGIDEVALIARIVEPLRDRQTSSAALAQGDEGAAALGPLVDRLGVKLGEAAVFRAAPVESAYPERSTRRVPALTPATGNTWPAALPRPSRIIDPPEAVRVIALVPDNPPLSFIWRRVRYVVKQADGPERIRGEWWRGDGEVGALRDYYRVEDDKGRRFWIFRDAPAGPEAGWWLHGRFS